jgi:transcription initiation factor TFIIIB Brf1 subunit/transcription initiation factor TFIIB
MKRCPECKAENQDHDLKCGSCGYVFPETPTPTSEEPKIVADEVVDGPTPPGGEIVQCPHCGSTRIHFITKETSSDFDVPCACCGVLTFGAPGLLCGLFGDSKKESTTTRKCDQCGKEF